MRLVLCDDHTILGKALAAALEERGHRVLEITTTAAAGVAAVAAHAPDVCLLDLRFPDGENGLDAARAIGQRYPGTKVLVLSAATDPEMLSEAMGIGIAGIIPKDQSIDQIAEALDVVAAGGAMFDAGLRRSMVSRQREQRPASLLERFSPREKEVLARIIEGQSTKQMARAMGITAGTVGMYVRNVLTNLGVHTRLQAVALATREGLLDELIQGQAWPSASHGDPANAPSGSDVSTYGSGT